MPSSLVESPRKEALTMFDRELTLYAFNLWYGQHLVADIPDEQLAEQPAEGCNHPAWVLGHLAAIADLGLHLLGKPMVLSPEWHELFDPGSIPSPERSLYPPKAELVATYEAAAGWVRAARVRAIALNTRGLDEDAATAEIDRVGNETGLPVTDPVRFGGDLILDAVL